MDAFQEQVVLAFKRDVDQQAAVIQTYLNSAQAVQDQKDPNQAQDISLMSQEQSSLQQLSQVLNQRIQNYLKQPAA